jgi:hypothetical protein
LMPRVRERPDAPGVIVDGMVPGSDGGLETAELVVAFDGDYIDFSSPQEHRDRPLLSLPVRTLTEAVARLVWGAWS